MTAPENRDENGLRFGLVGCGDIGRLRADAVARGGHRLVAACDLDRDRARSVEAAATGDDWKLLVRRDDLDAVLVCTPPDSHAEIAVAALEAGKAVLCEKPLARTVDEGRRMVRASRTAGRFLATGFNYRFYPSVRKARTLLREGRIGPLDHIRAYAGYSAEEHSHDWLHDHRVVGGGALRDNGIHLIDTACSFAGPIPIEDARGLGTNEVWGWDGCEDNGFLILHDRNGVALTLHASWTEWRGYRFEVELYGTRGCIRLSCFPMITRAVWREGGRRRRRFHVFPRTHLMERLRSYRWTVTESFVEELAEFAAAVRGRPSAVATAEDGLRALELAALGTPDRTAERRRQAAT